MNTRDLTATEKSNLDEARRIGVATTLLFLTDTGMRKSILDATLPLRTLMMDAGIHDYAAQGQGGECKRVVHGKIMSGDRVEPISISLYRPVTKKGDPRLWPARLTRHAKGGDVLAVFVASGTLHLLNLSSTSIAHDMSVGKTTPVTDAISGLRQQLSTVADELALMLRAIAARGPLPAVCEGDTAIGRTIETALGIAINSSRSPDFNGIEIKAKRWQRGSPRTRYTLFACVPTWNLSPCTSSARILEKYGYDRDGGIRKLYCTVSSQNINSQGLQFRIDADLSRLVEHAWTNQKSREDVAVWELKRLHSAFSQKHKETFWLQVVAVEHKGKQAFLLQEAVHTRGPSLPQFDRFLQDGYITMDHLIKKQANGRVSEKGPLFKVDPCRKNDLFISDPERIPLL